MKTWIMFFLFFLAVQILSAQEQALQFETGTPELAGMSSARIKMAETLIEQYVAEGKIPGGVFLLARYGQVVMHKAFGYRSQSPAVPYSTDDIFRIASMTKAVTTVAILQLYEAGKLGLDDPVFLYLPAFKEQQVLDTFNEKDSTWTTVPAKSPVTIRQLLTHTSGITYGEFNPGKVMAVYAKNNVLNAGLNHPEWTSADFIDRLGKTPLVFQPGERYMYGLNMDVLGRIVEVVSGKSLQDYFTENIFNPLGMNDTRFYLPKEKHHRLVPVYTLTREGKLMTAGANGGMNYPLQEPHPFYAGGGGLVSTAPDYAKFAQSLSFSGFGGEVALLSRKTIAMMTSDQMITLNQQGKGMSNLPGITMGLGFAVINPEGTWLSSRSAGTFEWSGYFNTKFFIDPQEQIIFTGMTQIVPFQHNEFWDRLFAIIYSAIED